MNVAIDSEEFRHIILIRKDNVDYFVSQTENEKISLASHFAKKLAIAYCGIPTVLQPGIFNTELGRLRRAQPAHSRWNTKAGRQILELNESSLVEQNIDKAKIWFDKSIELFKKSPTNPSIRDQNLDTYVHGLTLNFVYACIETSYYNNDQKIVWDQWLFLAWELLNAKFNFSVSQEADIDNYKTAANIMASVLICAGKPDTTHIADGLNYEVAAQICEKYKEEIENKLKFSAYEAGDTLSLLFLNLQRANSTDILSPPVRKNIAKCIQQIHDRFLPDSDVRTSFIFEFNKGMPKGLFLSLINANLVLVEKIRLKKYRALVLISENIQEHQYITIAPNIYWLEMLYALIGITKIFTCKIELIYSQSEMNDPHEGLNGERSREFEAQLADSWFRVKEELNSELKNRLHCARELLIPDPVAIYIDTCWSIFDCKNDPDKVIEIFISFSERVDPMRTLNFYEESFLRGLVDRVNYESNSARLAKAKLDDLNKYNEEIEKKNRELNNAKSELEDMMAMFAHKFRGPVDSIVSIANAEKNTALFKEIGRTMNGLLDIFSFVSSHSEKLLPKLREDTDGPHTLKHVVHKSLWLAIVQLMAKRNVDRMNMFYFNYAKREQRIPADTTFSSWRKNKAMRDVREAIRSTWELDIGSYGDSEDLDNLLVWCRSKLMNIQISGVKESDIHFSDSGTKESLLLVILTEMLVNAIKHYDPASVVPLVLSWDAELATLICTNPTSEVARKRGEGSGRGLKFLTLIATNVEGKFIPPHEGDEVRVVFSFSKLVFQ